MIALRRRQFIPVLVAGVILLAGLAACGSRGEGGIASAEQVIRSADLAADVRALADDSMEGRLPGTPGEERATKWIASAFERAGLQPAAAGGWFQPVPLVGITTDPEKSLIVEGAGDPLTFAHGRDFMGGTTRETERIEASGEIVFVGYGVSAPEHRWDDYKGVDVRGKILMMLVNDPPLADETRFGGRAMTYYGRWTYKFEVGAEKGAAGVLLVHDTEAAGYPWGVVQNSWAGEQFVPERSDASLARLPFESWITTETARALAARAGLDFEDLRARAGREDFAPVPLGLTASLAFDARLRRVESKNVAGLLPGSDPAAEWVLYTAHWDHLGISTPQDGDAIYNGAFDNATGVAALAGIARAFAALPEPPRRSILFLAVTAEEQGLIGSAHYAAQPLHPLARTAAVINMDGMTVLGRTTDVVVVGMGQTTLEDILGEEAARQGRELAPDPEPEKGFYYRSDQFPFAKQGVPALATDPGVNYRDRPAGWGLAQNRAYTAERYHKPSDEFDPAWDFTGLEEDARLLFRVGWRVTQNEALPDWKPGSEFRAARQRSLAAAGAR